jgi:hypothetical protein
MHQRTDGDVSKNHILSPAKYVVLVVNVHMSVRLIGQCLRLFDLGYLVRDSLAYCRGYIREDWLR